MVLTTCFGLSALAGLPSAHADDSTTTGGISGTVTAADTQQPLAGKCVVAMSGDTVAAKKCGTSRTGSYELDGLAAGSYEVGVGYQNINGTGPYVPTWYGGSFDRTTAQAVIVVAGTVTPSIDIALPTGGVITGKLTDGTSHKPLGSSSTMCVYAYPTATTGYPNTTGSDAEAGTCSSKFKHGVYQLPGLPSGQYHVYFNGAWLNGPYADQWFRDVSHKSTAKPVTVQQGRSTTGIGAAMVRSGGIKGVEKNLYYAETFTATNHKNYVSVDYWPGKNGSFQMYQLKTGTYYVEFFLRNNKTIWYGGSPTFNGAAPIHVTWGQVTHI